MHSVEESSTFEKSSGVFFFKGEQLTGSLSEVGEEEMNSPDLTFALEAVLSDELQFAVDSFLLERSSRSFEGCRIYMWTYIQFL